MVATAVWTVAVEAATVVVDSAAAVTAAVAMAVAMAEAAEAATATVIIGLKRRCPN